MRRKLRVYVDAHNGYARISLHRRWQDYESDKIFVGIVDLSDGDAEEKLADARARAKDLARQLNALEGA